MSLEAASLVLLTKTSDKLRRSHKMRQPAIRARAGGPAVPASFFGIVLGLIGLGNDWRSAAVLWGAPHWPGEAIMVVASVIWLLLLFLYIRKWLRLREEALAELYHPIQCCFIGLVGISTLLIAIAVAPYSRTLALVLLAVGIIGQLSFAVYRSGSIWQGGRQAADTTAVLYLLTVAGNFVSAIAASALGFADWGVFFFGAGLLSWLAIESVIIHRLYMVDPLPVALRATLGIQLAPPAVGALAYLSITSGPPDLVAQAMVGYGLLQMLLLIRLWGWIRQQPFSASYWAFTFGVSALALAVMRLVERGLTGPAQWAALPLFVFANVFIGSVAIGAVWLLVRGKVLPAGIATAR